MNKAIFLSIIPERARAGKQIIFLVIPYNKKEKLIYSDQMTGRSALRRGGKKVFPFLIEVLRRITSGKDWRAKSWDRSCVKVRQARGRREGRRFLRSSGALRERCRGSLLWSPYILRIRWRFSCGRYRKDAVPSLGLFEELFVSAELLLWGGSFCAACLGNIPSGEHQDCMSIVIFRHCAVDKAQRISTDAGDALPIL